MLPKSSQRLSARGPWLAGPSSCSGDCGTVQVSCSELRDGQQRRVGRAERVNENFSLIVMCIFLLASLAFLAEQLTSYH